MMQRVFKYQCVFFLSVISAPNFNFLPRTIDVFENRTSPFKTVDATARHPDGSPFTYAMVSSPPGAPFTIDSGKLIMCFLLAGITVTERVKY